MMPPTSIDGTDITGASIDGTDVQEITVDGQTVFSAQTLPVAFSNLIAWYPFDSAEYGGANADDVTAIIGGSGDDTAYNGTVNGATYQSSDGVTDINGGANSGAYEFDSTRIDVTGFNQTLAEVTFMAWVYRLNGDRLAVFEGDPAELPQLNLRTDASIQWGIITSSGGNRIYGDQEANLAPVNQNVWEHWAVSASNINDRGRLYKNGTLVSTVSDNGSIPIDNIRIGHNKFLNHAGSAYIDDVRFYDTELTSTQINQIITNTQP